MLQHLFTKYIGIQILSHQTLNHNQLKTACLHLNVCIFRCRNTTTEWDGSRPDINKWRHENGSIDLTGSA